jgi:hypothetical protein
MRSNIGWCLKVLSTILTPSGHRGINLKTSSACRVVIVVTRYAQTNYKGIIITLIVRVSLRKADSPFV